MKICGFNKTTLLDYPGRVACTIFLGGCNFHCPFCQNGGLVERPHQQPEYSREEILSFLKKRKGILDGVCISGGEPTLSPALGSLLLDIKSLCPFCQNGGLVERPEQQPEYSREEILSFLKKRKGILDGVCISGGEPTLSPALGSLLLDIKSLGYSDIKSLGYSIKLDTNGSRPDILKSLAKDRLIDMIAMDIKTRPGRYSGLTGVAHLDLNAIYESVDFLMSGTIDYEFRTTVVKELHTEREPLITNFAQLL